MTGRSERLEVGSLLSKEVDSAVMTPQEYEDSLRKLDLKVYMFGRPVENPVDDPIIRPSMKAVAKTYELAHRPEH